MYLVRYQVILGHSCPPRVKVSFPMIAVRGSDIWIDKRPTKSCLARGFEERNDGRQGQVEPWTTCICRPDAFWCFEVKDRPRPRWPYLFTIGRLCTRPSLCHEVQNGQGSRLPPKAYGGPAALQVECLSRYAVRSSVQCQGGRILQRSNDRRGCFFL